MSQFPPVSKLPRHQFGLSCTHCSRTVFVPFRSLIEQGYGDLPYDVVARRLSCAGCGAREGESATPGGTPVSVNLHGAGA